MKPRLGGGAAAAGRGNSRGCAEFRARLSTLHRHLRPVLSRLFVHIVWTTRDRAPLISPDVADFLRRFLPAVAGQERCEILELGMVSDHVHVLALLHPTTSIPTLLQRLKGGSAVIASREGVTRSGGLKWSKGYSIRSVSPKDIAIVRAYVRGQPDRHPDRLIA